MQGQGDPQEHIPPQSNFFHFHAVFGKTFYQIIGWYLRLWSWCAPVENSGFATGLVQQSPVHRDVNGDGTLVDDKTKFSLYNQTHCEQILLFDYKTIVRSLIFVNKNTSKSRV